MRLLMYGFDNEGYTSQSAVFIPYGKIHGVGKENGVVLPPGLRDVGLTDMERYPPWHQ